MKRLSILFLLLSTGILLAETIPVRDPDSGEGRPSWWWSCWLDHIIVIKGTIHFEADGKADVTVSISDEASDAFYSNVEERELQESYSKFYLGTIAPEKVLYATSGIEWSDRSIARALKEDGSVNIVIPTIKRNNGQLSLWNIKDGQQAVFIFKYGSMLPTIPLILEGPIPEDEIHSAEEVFRHREKYDHRKSK